MPALCGHEAWRLDRVVRWLAALLVVIAGVAAVITPRAAPWFTIAALITVFAAVVRGWRAARGTALRGAVAWAGGALVLAAVGQGVATGLLDEFLGATAGHWTYLAVLAALAALISVLNARSPGEGAWALLMALLVLVFLVPWLESAGPRGARGTARLGLEMPWSIFYGLLVGAGLTNYLPTRYGPAALVLGLGFVLEYVGLTRTTDAQTRLLLWTSVALSMAASIILADASGVRPRLHPTRLEALWCWFRDHWGVVWALRVQERFNRTAETQRWSFRLSWHGLTEIGPRRDPDAALEAAEATLVSLLRRFADPARLEEAAANVSARPCERSEVG